MSNPLTNKKNLSIFTAVLGFMGLYAPNANGGWFWNRSPRVVYVTPQPRVVYATQPNVVVQPAPQVVVVPAPQVVQPTVTQTQVPAPVQLTPTPVANAPAPQAAPVTESSAATRTDQEQKVLNDLFDNLPKGKKIPVKDQQGKLFILTRGEDNFSAAPADIQEYASMEKACEGMEAGDARVVQIANETGLQFISAEKDDKGNIQYLQISLEKDKLPTVTMDDTSVPQPEQAQISASKTEESAQVAPVQQATPVVSQPVVVTQPTPVVVQQPVVVTQPTPVVVQPSLSAWRTIGVCADTARIFLDYYYGVRECWHYRGGRFERRRDYRPAPPPPRHYDSRPAPRMGGYEPRPNDYNRPSGRQGNVTIINNNVTNNTTNVNVYKETNVHIRRDSNVWIDRHNQGNTGKRPHPWHNVPVTPQETTPSPASPGPGGGSAAPADRTTIDCTPTPTQQTGSSTPNRLRVDHKRRHSPVTVVQERPRPTTNPGNTNAGVPSTPSRNRPNPRSESPYNGSGTGHVYTNGSVVTTGSSFRSKPPEPVRQTWQPRQQPVQDSGRGRSVLGGQPATRPAPAQHFGGGRQAPQMRQPQRSFPQPRMLHQAPSAGHMRYQSGRRGR